MYLYVPDFLPHPKKQHQITPTVFVFCGIFSQRVIKFKTGQTATLTGLSSSIGMNELFEIQAQILNLNVVI